MADVLVDSDAFGASLAQILGDLGHACDGAVQKGVRVGGKTARKEWRKHKTIRGRGEYVASIAVTFGKSGDEYTAEVGSKTLPGLPHLIEKGHATLGGGRTRAYPHIAPAFEVAAKKTYETVLEGVDAAVEG